MFNNAQKCDIFSRNSWFSREMAFLKYPMWNHTFDHVKMYLIYEIKDSDMKINLTHQTFISLMELEHFHVWNAWNINWNFVSVMSTKQGEILIHGKRDRIRGGS